MLRGQGVGIALAAVAWGCTGEEPGAPSHGPDDPAFDLTGNDRFETAYPVVVGDPAGTVEVVASVDQVDFFRFEGTAGQWMWLTTNSGGRSPNTVVTLYDSQRRQIARNDEGSLWSGDGFDARLITRLPAEGTYFVSVSSAATPPALIGAGLAYKLVVAGIDEDTSFVVPDADFPFHTDVALARDLELSNVEIGGALVGRATVLGTFGPQGDLDVYAIDVDRPGALLAIFQPGGVNGSGSTTSAGEIWITDLSGGEVIARIDQTNEQHTIRPTVEPGRYLLWVYPPGPGVGENDFYTVDTVLVPENPREMDDAANGTLAGAEPLADFGTLSTRGYVLAHLPPQDIDYFSFELYGESIVQVQCSSRSVGSSLLDLNAMILDEDGRIRGVAFEPARKSLDLSGVYAPAAGTYYLRIASPARLDDVTGDWARCAVFSELL